MANVRQIGQCTTKLWSGQASIWPSTVTLTFEIWTSGSVMNLCLIKVNIDAKYKKGWSMHEWDTARTRSIMVIFEVWPLSVTLTFELETCILRTAHCLMVFNTFAKLFKNESIYEWDTARTRSIMVIFDVWPLSVTLTIEIETWILSIAHNLTIEPIY